MFSGRVGGLRRLSMLVYAAREPIRGHCCDDNATESEESIHRSVSLIDQ